MTLKAWLLPLGVLVFGTSVLLAGDVRADKYDQDRAREALLRGEIVPLTDVLKVVGKEFQGDVIEVELEEKKRRIVYEIKILAPGGRVLEIEVDAKTLEILDVDD